MHFYLLFASVLVLSQRCRSHIGLRLPAVLRVDGTFHGVSDDAMRGVIDDLVGDVTRNSISSSDYCAGIVAEYGSAASDYMRCVFLHAREFKKCRSCSEIYVVADDMYRNITEAREKDSQDSCFIGNCQQNNSTLVAISEVNNFIQTSWKASLCSYCFVDPSPNGRHSSQLNNRTSDFFHLLSNFQNCVLNYTQEDIDLFNDRSNCTGNLSAICHDCHADYSLLNDFYKKLEDNDVIVCSDMENVMNLTRSLWNDSCHKVVHDVMSMVVVGILATFPFIFYTATAINGKNPHILILRQKRWEHVMLLNEPTTHGLPDSHSPPIDDQ